MLLKNDKIMKKNARNEKGRNSSEEKILLTFKSYKNKVGMATFEGWSGTCKQKQKISYFWPNTNMTKNLSMKFDWNTKTKQCVCKPPFTQEG